MPQVGSKRHHIPRRRARRIPEHLGQTLHFEGPPTGKARVRGALEGLANVAEDSLGAPFSAEWETEEQPAIVRDAGLGAARARYINLLQSDGAARHDGLNVGLYLDYKTFLPDDILALSDRISMAHSLEVRVPLVDHVLVETIFPLPDHVKAGRLQPKRLLRAALRDRLPAEHFSAPKRGFVGPTRQGLDQPPRRAAQAFERGHARILEAPWERARGVVGARGGASSSAGG